MQIIPLQAVPSQTFSFIDPSSNQWDIAVRFVGQAITTGEVTTNVGQIAFSFTFNGNILIQGITAVAGARIIPYTYLENGNFALITQSQQIPDYTQFGITQTLVYLSESDIQVFRQPLSSLVQITASDFDPNGALPLRFSPQGYTLA